MNTEPDHNYYVTCDLKLMDFAWIIDQLRQTYFGKDRTEEQMLECMRNSLCFALMRRDYIDAEFPSHRDRQVGFARIVTDGVLFSWLADFIIDPKLRGKGLGHHLMHVIVTHHFLKTTTINLCTRDAQSFYRKFGFVDGIHLLRRPTDYA